MFEFTLDSDKVKIIVDVTYLDKAGDFAFDLYLEDDRNNKVKIEPVIICSAEFCDLQETVKEEIFKNVPEECYDTDRS